MNDIILHLLVFFAAVYASLWFFVRVIAPRIPVASDSPSYFDEETDGWEEWNDDDWDEETFAHALESEELMIVPRVEAVEWTSPDYERSLADVESAFVEGKAIAYRYDPATRLMVVGKPAQCGVD